MEKQEEYRGYVIGWQEPRLITNGWPVSVASDDRELQARLEALVGGKGSHVINGQSREETIRRAKALIDQILK